MEICQKEIIEVEKNINYIFPLEYKNYLIHCATLTKDAKVFKVGEEEKIVRYFYSMDPNSKTYILKFQKFDSSLNEKLVPFAELEFGDTICFERGTNKIFWYNHELDSATFLADTWDCFFSQLY